ncbi:MAG: glycosyltransferase family 39 protein [Anaerolineae bacterium]|nr:glycosyltransferase family 39 protein [Anaerolineae bacterium]
MTAENPAFPPLKSTKATLWLLLITWVAFLVRAINLATQSLWRDEVDAIHFSSWPLPELIAGLFRAGHNGPLFFLLLRPWRALTSDTEFALRYPAALLGTLAVPLGFILSRQLGLSRVVGLLGGLLLATSPYLVWYGQEAKMYALLLVLVTLALTAYLKALTGARLPPPLPQQKWLWWVVFVTATTLSYYTHILSPLMLAVYGVIVIFYHAHWRQHWRGWLISMALLTLPYLPLALWQIPLLGAGFQSGHPFYPLQKEFYLLLQLYSSGLVPFAPADALVRFSATQNPSAPLWLAGLKFFRSPAMGLMPIILLVFLWLCGLFLDIEKNSTLKARAILAVWSLLPPLIVYFISLRVAVFEDRYLIYIVPAFYLLVADGLGLIWRHSRRLVGICLILVLGINLTGLWQQQHRPLKADFRAAAVYLSNQSPPPSAIMVQIPYLQHTFNYYYHTNYTLLEGLWTNDDKTEATVDAEMTKLTAGLTDLWLVVSEEELWDNRHLTRAWLNKHAHLVDEAHFMRVDVYHYQMRPGTIEVQGAKFPAAK